MADATAAPTPAEAGDEFLDQEDVARILKVSVPTVRNLGNRGELEYVRIGRQRRIRRSALDAYLAAATHTPEAAAQ